MPTYNEYMKNLTAQHGGGHSDNPIHQEHIVEFRQMCASMIEQALKQHDEQLQIEVQGSMDGGSFSMGGLVSGIKQQITSALRKAFK